MENGHSCNINNLSVNIENIFLFLSRTLSPTPSPFPTPSVGPPALCIGNRKIIRLLQMAKVISGGTP